jgi:uncharacterized damage-inducible protein DinB
MKPTPTLEVWLRGPLPNIPSLLQPVAHALLQAREEVEALSIGFPDDKLWERPVGMASIGFHLQHLTGVLDRLLTYARAETLTAAQLQWLANEGKAQEEMEHFQQLYQLFSNQVDKALAQIQNTDESTLTQTRGVGRAQIPSTVLGLLFHAAEHTQRHVGQLIVTVAILKSV